jgi:putative transposase
MWRNQAAKRFGIAISTAIHSVPRYLETSRVAPSKDRRQPAKVIKGEYREWLPHSD